jgi:hypothetical protein
MKANKTRKNKKQSGGFQFLTDMFNKGKEGWNKGKQSLSQTSKNMFSPKPKPVATTPATTAPMPAPAPMPVQGPVPMNNQTGVPIDVPPYTDPMAPLTPITAGGRRRQKQRQKQKSQKKRLSKKKRYSRKKRGGYNLNDSAPVSGLKVASPTYWIGGKKSKRRRRKSRR